MNIFGNSPEEQPPEPIGGISLHGQDFPFMKHGAPGSLRFTDTHYWCQDQAMGTNQQLLFLLPGPQLMNLPEVRNTLAISLEQTVK